jgi:hypothetical protein
VFAVSGTVAGLDMLPATSAGEGQISFNAVDSTAAAIFPLNETTGAWQGSLPPGTFRAGIRVVSDTGDQIINISNLGTLTVSNGPATGSFAVPPTVQVSGTVTLAGQPAASTGTWVFASDAGGFGNNAAVDANGNYHMILADNRDYRFSASVDNNTEHIVFSPSGGNLVHVSGATTVDLTFPELPGTVTLSGKVTDPSGYPVAGTTVIASSNFIAGAPGVVFANAARTDNGGNYSITLLSGTNYQVVFDPQVIALSAVDVKIR